MAGGQNAQVVGYQLEKVLSKITRLFILDHLLFDKIKKGDVETISSRAMRMPADMLQGGNLRQINPDAGPAGRGSAIVADYMQMTSVYFSFALEFSKLFEWATQGDEKAVVSAPKHNVEMAMDRMRQGIEALIAGGDGSGTLDTVVGTTGNAIQVNNANQFNDQQILQLSHGLGDVPYATIQVLTTSASGSTQLINIKGALPPGIVAGDLLLLDGSPGVQGGSLNGIQTFQSDSPVGTYLNIPKASYPDRLITPHVALAGKSVNQFFLRLLLQRIKRGLGVKLPQSGGLMWHTGPDQTMAWEQVVTNVSVINWQELKGTSAPDMLMKDTPSTAAGRPILESDNALVGRWDGLCLDFWLRGETKSIGPLDFGGQTVFPTYSYDGSPALNSLTYLTCGFQIGNRNPRAGGYMDGAAIPNGL